MKENITINTNFIFPEYNLIENEKLVPVHPPKRVTKDVIKNLYNDTRKDYKYSKTGEKIRNL